MRHIRSLLPILILALFAHGAGAQVVETPVPFDSAGRVVAMTPQMAARAALGFPAWRITGDYREARLYRLPDNSYVVVVTRPTGAVERYPITAEEREELRVRTSALPPGIEEQLGRAGGNFMRITRNNEFVRNQTIIGLLFYAPSFAYAITDDAAGWTAAYLLAAGGTFFAAAELTRRIQISDAQNAYATHFGSRGTLIGVGLAHALGGEDNWLGAGGFLSGVGGTALGVTLGRTRSVDEAAATGFGADAMIAMTAVGQIFARDGFDEDNDTDEDYPTRGEAGVLVGSALVGYQLGALYPRLVRYNVSEGDVRSLWVTGAIGMLGASAAVGGADASNDVEAAALIGGFATGVVVGNFLNVRRTDLSLRQANTIALGTGAGALMGAGLYVLIDRERDNDGVARGLATAGAVAGYWLTERFVEPAADAGSPFSMLEINPAGLALAASGMRGRYPIISLTF